LGHWKTLTRWVQIAGAPLDTNLGERALKLFIRQRPNALFYKNPPRAYIASVLTSLIAPCLHAGGNALDYLVALQEHRPEGFAAPSAWVPWNYQASRAPPEATRRQSWANWASSGLPFHNTIISARAERGTRASALWGHQENRPFESLFRHNQ
jgi:hypothetical protein